MNKKNFRKLTPQEEYVIEGKGTENPFSGKYDDFFGNGVYVCKRCNTPLYRSDDKFHSGCGWPSFDDEIKGAVIHQPDADGRRIEILCANCGGHLGHVFKGEHLTDKNTRHCVNSISLLFIPARNKKEYKKAYYAGGCFWGVEHLLQSKKGVVSVLSGYMGGYIDNPTYNDVCFGMTGHLETVEVTYDPEIISYKDLTKLFFEIHDPTQDGGQGPDIGEQYESAIFVNDENEKKTVNELIEILKSKKYDVVTKVLPVAKFWKAEDYHQDYYDKTGKIPYCHTYRKKF